MGLFSSKKKIYVASTCYNLAGDELDRPNYLKSLVLRNILSGTKDSIGDTLIRGYLKGPGVKMRTFFRWADGFDPDLPGNYDYIGMPSGFMSQNGTIPLSLLAPHVPLGSADSIWVQYAESGIADFGVWVEQWILDNEPERIEENWSADINEAGVCTLTREDDSEVTIPLVDFDKNKNYIYIYYNEIFGEVISPIEPGTLDVLGTDPFADTTGWTLTSTVTTSEVTSPSSLAYDKIVRTYERVTYMGRLPGPEQVLYSLKEYRTDTHDQIEIAGPALEDYRTTVTDEQEIVHSTISTLKVMIYQIKSGTTALDELFELSADYGKFYPPIPVRIDGVFLSEDDFSEEYEVAKKAYKKATDNDFDELIEKLAENEDIGDIDYAYVVFGVSINVLENACRHYMWEFFQYLRNIQSGGPSAYNGFTSNYTAYKEAYDIWQEWSDAQSIPSDPLYNTPEPDFPDRDIININEFVINNVGVGTSPLNYDVRISWTYIAETETASGLGKPGAKRGDFWLEYQGEDEFLRNVAGATNDPLDASRVETIRMYYQIEDNQYQYIDVVGMIHRNYIYGGKYVETTAKQGLEATEESGFIFPLHNGTYRQLPLAVSTQMATAVTFLVLNSYQIVKVRWYQRGIFKIIFVIVLAVLSVVFTGGSTTGLLFSAMKVGSVVAGVTVTYSAAIFAAVANALAALVLVTIIEAGAVALFGDEIGAIIGAIAGVIAGGITVGANGIGSFALNWSEFLKVDNLLKLTNAISRGYMGYVNAKIEGMSEELAAITADSEQQQRELLVKQYEEFGASGQLINPMMLVDLPNVSSRNSTSRAEVIRTVDDFLSQTLLLGSEISDISRNLLYDFVELSLRLPDVDEAK
jgi:hypothetical protein